VVADEPGYGRMERAGSRGELKGKAHHIQIRRLESKFYRVWTPNGLRVTSSTTWKRTSIFVTLCFVGLCFGGPEGIRTLDLFHAI
jgi:hypothetical protein